MPMSAKHVKKVKKLPNWKVVGSRAQVEINISDVLGHGGFGKVFCGKFDGVEVAVKRMDRHDAKIIKRELLVLNYIKHENVLEYLFSDIDDEYHYLVLDKCKYTLQEHIEANDLKDVDKIDILRQTAKGLAYLHSHNFIHRDVKLSNFLVKFDDKRLIIKLSDFGISKVMDFDKTSTLASLNGTRGYKSVEVLMGLRVRTLSDIFSLGIVFYKIISGASMHPFGTDSIDIEYNIKMRTEPHMDNILKSSLYKYSSVIERMLQHDSAARPSYMQLLSILGIPVFQYDTTISIPIQSAAFQIPRKKKRRMEE